MVAPGWAGTGLGSGNGGTCGAGTARLPSSTPNDGESNVYLNQTLFLEFSEAVKVGTLVVTLQPTAALDPAVVSHGGRLASIQPSQPLAPNTQYKLSVSATTVNGSVSQQLTFNTGITTDSKTGSSSANGPTFASTSPTNGQTLVALRGPISLLFSAPVNRASVQIGLQPYADLGAGSWTPESQQLTFPNPQLQPGVAYTLTATGSDETGRALVGAQITFTTVVNDSTPPQVITHNPALALQGVPSDASVIITFTKAMDRNATQTAFNAGVAGTFTWNNEGTVMTFTPSALWTHASTINWTVGVNARDTGGRALAAAYTGNFRVARLGQVDLQSVANMDGYVTNTGSVTDTNDDRMQIGDGERRVYRAFLTFNLNTLPANTVRIHDATVNVYQNGFQSGASPYDFLGIAVIGSVDYGTSVDTADWAAPLQTTLQCTTPTNCTRAVEVRTLATNTNTGYVGATATLKVQEDWAVRAAKAGRSQFRLNMSKDSTDGNPDPFFDLVFFNTAEANNNRPFLRVSYEYP
ncbi:MAG: Ig-like domain-containing protein [Myxococcaceae bacterium]